MSLAEIVDIRGCGERRSLRCGACKGLFGSLSEDERAALERMRADTLYVSTGGGWSPASDAAIRAIAANADMLIVAATDNDRQGEIYAGRLQQIVRETGCRYERLRPSTQDWNSDLQGRGDRKPGNGGGKESGIAAACPAVASREAAPGLRRPLTRRTGEAAARRGDEKA